MELKSVLVVEDEHDIRVAIRQLLESEGYFVFSSANGQSGLELLRRIKAPGLILLDLSMPICSGYDFLMEKNRDSAISLIPVVVMSAAGNACKVPTEGVRSFMPKPLEMNSLLKMVQKYCGTPESSKPGLSVATDDPATLLQLPSKIR